MLSYRPFRNTDPPAVVQIWRSRAGQRGLVSQVSADLFEQLVFGKLYFDYNGLILAWDGPQAVGLGHAGFGPDEHEAKSSTELGVVCLLMVRPSCPEAEVAAGLLQRCEAYLTQRGAKVIYGGGIRPLNPFYLGLYGGSELPGVIDSDTVALAAFHAHGYKEIDQTLILRRALDKFQAPVDREQLQLRRQMAIQISVDAPSRTWWEACTLADFDLTRFELAPRGGGPALAQATFRSMDPSGASGFAREAGLIDLVVHPDHRRQGLATFLLSEAFAAFARLGIMLVEAQTMCYNSAALGLYQKLGFQQVGQGSVFRKETRA